MCVCVYGWNELNPDKRVRLRLGVCVLIASPLNPALSLQEVPLSEIVMTHMCVCVCVRVVLRWRRRDEVIPPYDVYTPPLPWASIRWSCLRVSVFALVQPL